MAWTPAKINTVLLHTAPLAPIKRLPVPGAQRPARPISARALAAVQSTSYPRKG